MSTVAECLKKSILLENISDSARLDVELLLARALGKDRTFLYTWPEKELTEQEGKRFDALLSQRMQGKPIAYILGEKEFWSLILKVNEATLIPRPDTELLVELAVKYIHEKNVEVLDLGTGTGAIALAIASECSNANITAVDVLASAVQLAKENAVSNGINNVEFLQSNWFEHVGVRQFDLIVSNPPYIDKSDPLLNDGDVVFEPASALVAENKGLADIEFIVKNAHRYLKSGGTLLIEHGWKQGEQVQAIFKSAGFKNISTVQDYGGRDRVCCGDCYE